MFNEEAVFTTGGLLFWFFFTIVTHTFVTIMNQAFFAVKKTFMPLINSAISLCMTAGFGFFFSHKTSLGLSGLSLGYALGSLIGGCFMFFSFRKMYPALAHFNIIPFLRKILVASMGIVVVLAPLRICSVIGRRQEKLCSYYGYFLVAISSRSIWCYRIFIKCA